MVVLARAFIGKAAQVENDDVVRIEIDGHGQGLDRAGVVALVDQGVAAHGQRDRLVLAGEAVGVEQIVAGLRPGLELRLAVTADGEIVAGLRLGRGDRDGGDQGDEGQGNDAQHVVRPAPATTFLSRSSIARVHLARSSSPRQAGLSRAAFSHRVVSAAA
ncbi:hypothetical protein ACVI1J_005962 [Bradyrhizobium diazoefficiens]